MSYSVEITAHITYCESYIVEPKHCYGDSSVTKDSRILTQNIICGVQFQMVNEAGQFWWHQQRLTLSWVTTGAATCVFLLWCVRRLLSSISGSGNMYPKCLLCSVLTNLIVAPSPLPHIPSQVENRWGKKEVVCWISVDTVMLSRKDWHNLFR